MLDTTVLSREDAHANGLKTFYTGRPCKHGHTARRYVTTGGCIQCVKKYTPRLHPHTKDKVPYDGGLLWRSRRLNVEHMATLGRYLQQCVDAFESANLPPVCAGCDGTEKVPTGGGQWGPCPTCAGETA